MRIKDIVPGARLPSSIAYLDVKGITSDTRELTPDTLFFVVEGKNFDIFSLLKEAVHKIAVFVAEERQKQRMQEVAGGKPVIYVRDVKEAFRRAIDIFYPVDMKKIKFIGVTGTNGKTTTTHLIHHSLEKMGMKSALLGTVKYKISRKGYPAPYTTPDYLRLRKFLFSALERGVEYVVMEVSSHGIAQKRIEGIPFSGCIFTNLSRDHLDYHHTMENYFMAKRSFFTANSAAKHIINTDDKYGRRLFKDIKGARVSYGQRDGVDYRIKKISLKKRGVTFYLGGEALEQDVFVKSPLLGKHNIFNITAAVAGMIEMGFPSHYVLSSVSSFRGVPGRLEEVSGGIFVDYAHTPDALKNVLVTLRDSGYDKIILVFGCGGNRDKGKRKVMGRIASEFSFFSFITSDNPRNEDPRCICEQIKGGFVGKNFQIVIDRRRAIEKAIVLKDKYAGSAVLLAGKGHEKYQIIKGENIPFSDRAVIREYLKTGKV